MEQNSTVTTTKSLLNSPTLLDLMAMKGADGKPLRVIEMIAAGNYKKFGMYLLSDKNGSMVDLLKRNHIHDGAENVTQAILQKWLTSDAPTYTYQHLIECLRHSELGALAELIASAIKQADAQVTKQTNNPYVTYLRGLYTSVLHSHTSQHWIQLPRCEFIQLAMIDSGGVRRGDRGEEMVRLALQGRVETIMSYKQPIKLNIFLTLKPLVLLPPPLPTRIILIEGAPGGGKSTLALHICHQWAQGAAFLERFDLVVLVYLRDQAIQNATTLADILPTNIQTLSQTVATQIQSCDGQNVLFIFDGWDEFPSHLQENSIVSTIIRQPHKLSLHRSTVLITSRPVSSGNLLHIGDRRVEILGFTQGQIREYIEKALDDNSTRLSNILQSTQL